MEGEAVSVRYIGSKVRVLDELVRIAGPPQGTGVFVDAFCGTGVVAEAAANAGWAIRLNDSLHSAVIMASARLLASSDAPFSFFGDYQGVVRALNDCPGTPGFIWSEYSPASAQAGGDKIERRYFSEENAARIDGMRCLISQWSSEGAVTPLEESLLIADLLTAANKVANTAGTYGCFLRKWQPAALAEILIDPRTLRSRAVSLEIQCGDVSSVRSDPGDLVYLDPPYTKRQYAAYYHILETIAFGDTPQVSGVAGLRPWKHLSSPYCYKKRALHAIVDLVNGLDANRILLSYSDEGHMDLDDLVSELARKTTVQLHPIRKIGRYRPNQTASANSSAVTEYVIEVEKRRPMVGVCTDS